MLQSFIDARYKNGDSLTEDQVAGLLIAALFAGQVGTPRPPRMRPETPPDPSDTLKLPRNHAPIVGGLPSFPCRCCDALMQRAANRCGRL